MVFLNHFLKKNDFERNQQTIKKHEKLPRGGGGGGGAKSKKLLPVAHLNKKSKCSKI